MNDFFGTLYDFFASYDWDRFLFGARIISGVLSLGLGAIIAFTIKNLYKYNKPATHAVQEEKAAVPRKEGKGPWQAVLDKLGSENPSDWNLAIIQADSIVDAILKEMGLAGETMGERMKRLDTAELLSLNELWEAHRIRNQIAHSSDRTITKHQAVYAISLFEKVLKELEYLE